LDLVDVIQFVAQTNMAVREDDMSVERDTNVQKELDNLHLTGNENETTDLNSVSEKDDKTIMSSHSFDIFTTTSPTIYHGSVRSGQQVSSEKGRSLLILGSVSSGGEVMSDGDIYVFGKLRGRALAGLSQNVINDNNNVSQSPPRIVATTFDAELVCIGETFTTIDSVQDFGLTPDQAAMVTLENGTLIFQAII
jgi:septum site-determining protein MinC